MPFKLGVCRCKNPNPAEPLFGFGSHGPVACRVPSARGPRRRRSWRSSRICSSVWPTSPRSSMSPGVQGEGVGGACTRLARSSVRLFLGFFFARKGNRKERVPKPKKASLTSDSTDSGRFGRPIWCPRKDRSTGGFPLVVHALMVPDCGASGEGPLLGCRFSSYLRIMWVPVPFLSSN